MKHDIDLHNLKQIDQRFSVTHNEMEELHIKIQDLPKKNTSEGEA